MQSHEQITVPLSKLSLSASNVRRSERADIKSLAHSIKTQGVLHNLVVIPSVAGAKDRFEVIDGGRRLAALALLREEGAIKGTYGVPCQLVPDANAVAASLTANTERQAMSPADEFDAMKILIDRGQSIEDVAATFGVTPLVVKRRLKLANVAPKLIELYRAAKIDLEALMAFAATDDHAKQLAVYESLHKNNRHAYVIRQALTQDELPSDDRLVRFVTLKAYKKAGGPVRVDLFGDGNTSYVQDVALLHSLAQAKLDHKAQEAKDEEGAAWAEGRLRCDFAERQSFGRVGTVRTEPSAKVAKQLEKLNSELVALQDQAETHEDEAAYERIDALQEQLLDIEQTLERPDPRTLRLAGIIVTIDHAGGVEILRGLVRPEDKKALKSLGDGALAGTDSGNRAEEEEGGANLSGALRLNLSAHFTAALQARLDASPGVALRALAATLWSATTPEGLSDLPVTVRGVRPTLRSQAEGIDASAACTALAASHVAWEARLPVGADVLATLLTWPDSQVIGLLAHCTALHTAAVTQGAQSEEALALASAAGLDMRDYWHPTAENYLKRVPKSAILAALREVDPALDLAPFEKAKKAEVIGRAEPILVAAKWLPGPLRQQHTRA